MTRAKGVSHDGPAELWTVEDLAEFLRKPVSWVYENYRDRYPFYRVGQAVRFDPAEIKARLRDQRGGARSASAEPQEIRRAAKRHH